MKENNPKIHFKKIKFELLPTGIEGYQQIWTGVGYKLMAISADYHCIAPERELSALNESKLQSQEKTWIPFLYISKCIKNYRYVLKNSGGKQKKWKASVCL